MTEFPNIYYRFFRIGWRGEEAPTGWYYQIEEWKPPVGPYESKEAAESSLELLRNES
jgi:hypothetical protein